MKALFTVLAVLAAGILLGAAAGGRAGGWLPWVVGVPIFLVALAQALMGGGTRAVGPVPAGLAQKAAPYLLLFVLAFFFAEGPLGAAGWGKGGEKAAASAASVASGTSGDAASGARSSGREGALARFIREGETIRAGFHKGGAGREFSEDIESWVNRVADYTRRNLKPEQAAEWDRVAGGAQGYRFQPGLEFGPKALNALDERIALLKRWNSSY